MSSVSNSLYFLTLPLVSVMRVIKRNIEKVWGARYLYIIRDAGKVWGAHYLPKNMVLYSIHCTDITSLLKESSEFTVCVYAHSLLQVVSSCMEL
jgi:hypothetical protein